MAHRPDSGGNPEQHFVRLAEALRGEPGVTAPEGSGGRRFGSAALKVGGSIFAMVTRGHLVVKIPAERVSALIAEGVAGSFDAGKGTPMKEWATVLADDEDTWLALAREAMVFVHEARP